MVEGGVWAPIPAGWYPDPSHLYRYPLLLLTAVHPSSHDDVFWVVMTVAFSLTTLFMGVTWYKVKRGTRKPRKNYLAYLTTKRFRAMWEREKTTTRYYATRFWISSGWTFICFLKATHPNLR
jgi:hypothetical protein